MIANGPKTQQEEIEHPEEYCNPTLPHTPPTMNTHNFSQQKERCYFVVDSNKSLLNSATY
jgi:hypothetical protein